MSNLLLDQCWPLQMPPTPKAVLVSMADNADDSGACWPSITTICERTCFSRRAVIDAIAWLELSGAVVADRSNGRHTRYAVTPSSYAKPVQMPHRCKSRTGAPAASTGAPAAPDPCSSRTGPVRQMHSNHQEPSRTVSKATIKKRASAPPLPVPEGVDPQTWADWFALRKAKHAPVTETVIRQATAEAAKAGLTLERFLQVWCARGSQGLQADWLKPHERAGPSLAYSNPSRPSAAADFRGKTYDATPVDQLPAYLRDAARAAAGDG